MSMEMDAEDLRQAEEQNLVKKEHEEKLALVYGEVFKTGAGQFVLKDLSERCNFRNSCIRNVMAPNANAVLFQEGKRAVFNHIMFYFKNGNQKGKAR